ncbi:MAG: hypothetical protein IPN17_18640 [Deltaproteobacteria bacterium]|nr:hypothetical protein [Deltaproteobacteria bacterium]
MVPLLEPARVGLRVVPVHAGRQLVRVVVGSREVVDLLRAPHVVAGLQEKPTQLCDGHQGRHEERASTVDGDGHEAVERGAICRQGRSLVDPPRDSAPAGHFHAAWVLGDATTPIVVSRLGLPLIAVAPALDLEVAPTLEASVGPQHIGDVLWGQVAIEGSGGRGTVTETAEDEVVRTVGGSQEDQRAVVANELDPPAAVTIDPLLEETEGLGILALDLLHFVGRRGRVEPRRQHETIIGSRIDEPIMEKVEPRSDVGVEMAREEGGDLRGVDDREGVSRLERPGHERVGLHVEGRPVEVVAGEDALRERASGTEDPLGERLPPKGEDRPGLGRRGEQVLPVEEPVLSHEVAERGPLLLVAVEAAAEAEALRDRTQRRGVANALRAIGIADELVSNSDADGLRGEVVERDDVLLAERQELKNGVLGLLDTRDHRRPPCVTSSSGAARSPSVDGRPWEDTQRRVDETWNYRSNSDFRESLAVIAGDDDPGQVRFDARLSVVRDDAAVKASRRAAVRAR